MKTILAAGLFAGSLFAFQGPGQGQARPQRPPSQQQAPQPGQATATSTTPAPIPTGSIEGQIFNLATGAPLKRATVRLTMMGGRGRGAAGGGGPFMAQFGGQQAVLDMQGGRGPGQQMKETDDTGRFSFTALDAGRYQLSAERQGYLRANYGGRKYNTSGTPIVLGKDQHLTNMILKLNPQSVIVGKVLDEDGDPVANVNVRAYKIGYRNGKKQWVQAGSGMTSDIGEYRIPQLDPGRYIVASSQVRARVGGGGPAAASAPLPDAPEWRYAATYYPSTAQELNAAPVDVQPGGETRGIDIRLLKTQVYRVRGRVVVPAEGRNFPMVMIQSKDGTRGGPATIPARPPDYKFEITGLAPGSYILYAQAGGRQEQMLAFQTLEVGNRHMDGIVLSPTPGADVNGTVKVDQAQGGTPVDVSKLTVILRPAIDMGRPARGRAGANGAFVLNGVSPIHYTVDVNGIPEGCYIQSIYYGGRPVGDDGLDIVGGGTIDVTIGADAGSVTSSVLDKDGNPVSSATVALVAKEGGAIQGRTANESGGVTFSGLKPGEYTLIAWEDIPTGAWQDPDFVRLYSGTTVKVEPRGQVTVQVKAIPAE